MPECCEYILPADFIERFHKYLSSIEYNGTSTYSKSEYWEHQSDVVDIQIHGNKITMSGKSGFYFPQKKDARKQIKNKIAKLIGEPFSLIPFIKRKVGIQDSLIARMDYFSAFDKVMDHDPIIDPTLSANRINYEKLKDRPGILASVDDMRQKFFAKDKYELSPYIVKAYYYYSILDGYTDLPQAKAILEIGGGSGNLSSLLYSSISNCTVISVDLPETLCFAIVFIADMFPGASILLPNEEQLYDFNHYDFVFLTTEQTHLIKENSIDLAINIDSFQEMTHKQIEIYFQLIQRCCSNNSYFFTSNRVEKMPCSPANYQKKTSEPPNRFSDYPWNPANDILIYEINKLMRLVQLDNTYIRLEQVKK